MSDAPLDFVIFSEIVFVAYGMFLWDYLITLWFELYFIWGKLKLRWPLVPYFLTRYSALGFVIASILFQTSGQPLNCDALYLGGTLLGKVAVASASVNILVRTVIIWSYRWYIVLLLGLIVSGEVVLICLGLKNRDLIATWSDEFHSCTASLRPGTSSLAFFAPYALGVDCIILILTIVGLRKFEPKSGLANVLISQGLIFFLLVLPFQTFVTVSVHCNQTVSVGTSSALCALIVCVPWYLVTWSGLSSPALTVRPRMQLVADETVFNLAPTFNWGALRNDPRKILVPASTATHCGKLPMHPRLMV